MIVPQITYTDATGPATLDFIFPPINKPAYKGKAQRNDKFSTSGVRQSVVLRTDILHPINVEVIQDDGQDLPAWQRFVQWAEQGGPFVYYPDVQNQAQGLNCFMVEPDGVLTRASTGVYSFAATFQEEVQG